MNKHPWGCRARLRAGSLMAAALALGGCGASRNEIEPGFPPPNPRPYHAAALSPLLSGQHLRIAVPVGWSVARLNDPTSARKTLVRLAAPCYQSISITGSSIQVGSQTQIFARYSKPFQGYAWTLNRAGGRLIALLAQYTSQSSAAARATVGVAYVPLDDAGRQLAIDFGAGVWPLHRGACTDSHVAALLASLRATVLQTFAQAQVSADGPQGATSP